MNPVHTPLPPGASREASGAALPPLRLTARGVLLAAALWALYALLYSTAIVVFAGAPLGPVLLGQAAHAAFMFAFSAVPWWLVVRGMAERPARQRLAAHAAGLAGYTAAVTAALLAFSRMGGREAYEATLEQGGWIAFSTALAYVAQFAVYHAVAASRRAEARERQAEAVRHLAREQELRALRAQLNPHFLFNALNTVNALIGQDPAEARETVGRLADLLRYALQAGRHDRVPLADELAFTRRYLDLERARMGDRLRVDLRVAPEALGTPVPPMAVQTLVENAVRHAVAPNPDGGTVRITVAPEASGARGPGVRGPGVRVEVGDTGRGAGTAAPGAGTGLANTDERLRLLFGPGAALDVDRDDAGGWTVAFTLPGVTASGREAPPSTPSDPPSEPLAAPEARTPEAVSVPPPLAPEPHA